MKKFLLFPLAAALSAATLFAQPSNGSSYEAWAQQKREAYERWRQKRQEIASRLPQSEGMDRVSSFIDAGFAPSTTTPAAASATAAAPAAPFKVWAVVVGVADYRLKASSLKYTKDDAYRMYAFYKSPEGGALPDRQIALLIDEDATRANIVNALRRVYAQAGKNDVLIFYFSGHGAEGAFITHEFSGAVDESLSGLLLHRELHELFQASPARYKYLIADACHSGSMAHSGAGAPRAKSGGFYQAFDKAQGGFAMILSSMSDEYSLEVSGVRQGIFSHYLLRGLRGESDANRDKTVSVVELFDFVQANVKSYSKGRQNPIISGSYDELLPMAVLRE